MDGHDLKETFNIMQNGVRGHARHIYVQAWRALWCGNLAATEAPWHDLRILFLTITLGFHGGTAFK